MTNRMSKEHREELRWVVKARIKELRKEGVLEENWWKRLAKELNDSEIGMRERDTPWKPEGVARMMSSDNGKQPRVKVSARARENVTQVMSRKMLLKEITGQLQLGKTWKQVAEHMAERGILYRQRDGTLIPWTNKQLSDYYSHGKNKVKLPRTPKPRRSAQGDKADTTSAKQTELTVEEPAKEVEYIFDPPIAPPAKAARKGKVRGEVVGFTWEDEDGATLTSKVRRPRPGHVEVEILYSGSDSSTLAQKLLDLQALILGK